MSKHRAEDLSHDLQDLAENWPNLDMDLVRLVDYATAEQMGAGAASKLDRLQAISSLNLPILIDGITRVLWCGLN